MRVADRKRRYVVVLRMCGSKARSVVGGRDEKRGSSQTKGETCE